MSTLQQRRIGGNASTSPHDETTAEAMPTTATASTISKPWRPKKVKSGRSGVFKEYCCADGGGGIPPSIAFGMCCMVTVWLFIPLFMIHYGYWSNSVVDLGKHAFIRSSAPVKNTGDGTTQIQLLRNDVGRNVIAARAASPTKAAHDSAPTGKYRKLESEVIDMRIMSATLPFDDKDGGVWKQGWELDPIRPSSSSNADHHDGRPFQIFVLPHSHCDPGWIKTFDEYFKSQTSNIITSVITALALDKRRKFIWAEISYFEWWWNEQSTDTRNLVKQLLQSGQLEFVTGGWVQPDEANTELYAMEIQLQEGHDWIRKNVGEQYVPKYGWSIDPFGYSPTMAYLLNKYGFEGMLIQRVHYAVKKELASKKQLEFMWRQTWDTTGKHDIFTHLMPFYSYDVPHTCGPDPSVCCQFDFARQLKGHYGDCPWHKQPQTVTAANVHSRAMLLLDQYLKKASLYRGKALLIPLGDDFRYQTSEEAESQYRNYQTIFDYINQNVPNVEIQFGTLSDYFNEVIGSFEAPILKGSFFTYADRAQDYWSGYFTSRVFDKALDRKLERVLYAAEALGATKEELREPRRALSLFQHHDGVTGTAKTYVVEDYAKRMHSAIRSVQAWLKTKIVPNGGSGIDACWRSDSPRGMSKNLCAAGTDVIVYNPLNSPQKCGAVTVAANTTLKVKYPCATVTGTAATSSLVKFDKNGMVMEPVQEQWTKWKVTAGGAYLFFPGTLEKYPFDGATIEEGGWVVTTDHWKRTLVQHEYTDEFGTSATVFDFIYETNLQVPNEEWFVRFTSKIQNAGVFHTDLNGFNFDTHKFRDDMPIQSQVFPMPTLASIEDRNMRMSIISEHAQGTASLETGAIDVWLDRRLGQDDNRGLGQPVMDNVPTRTRLRVVLERDVSVTKEFEITPLCRRMWDELNHPLESFGAYADQNVAEVSNHVGAHFNFEGRGVLRRDVIERSIAAATEDSSTSTFGDESTPIIPFVIMVFKRIDYLKECIDSIRKSDLNKTRIPIVISQDGNVPEMTEYIDSIQNEFLIHRIVHPYSCYGHPDSFPGDAAGLLNKDYAGDTYKHPRDGKVTCCKHHFTWLMKTVHSNLTLTGLVPTATPIEHFFFLEEDYVVAPNIYETIVTGVGLLEIVQQPPNVQLINTTLFGLILDPTNGQSQASFPFEKDGFYLTRFVTGPMVLSKSNLGQIIQQYAKEFCEFDDYNWDWSIVHIMAKFHDFSHLCLVPTKPQVKHIGVQGGMHAMSPTKRHRLDVMALKPDFHPRELMTLSILPSRYQLQPGYGGWGHLADHQHCLNVLQGQ